MTVQLKNFYHKNLIEIICMLSISRDIAAHFTTLAKRTPFARCVTPTASQRLFRNSRSMYSSSWMREAGPAHHSALRHKSRTSSWRRNSSGYLAHRCLSDISLTEYNQHCLYSVCRLAFCSISLLKFQHRIIWS